MKVFNNTEIETANGKTTQKAQYINLLINLLASKDGQAKLLKLGKNLNSDGNLRLVLAWRAPEFKKLALENGKCRAFLASKDGKQVAKVLELDHKEIVRIQKELGDVDDSQV